MSNHDRHGSRPSNGDGALERAWRDASDEQPPSHLDAAIIAAARKSVPDGGEQPTTAPARVQSRNWLTRWQPLAAAATVAGLAFVLVQMLPREHDLAPSIQYQEPAPVPAAAMPQASSSSVPAVTDSSQLPSADEAVTAEATAREPAAPADTAAVFGEASADRQETAKTELAGRAATAAAAAPSSPARERDAGNAASLDAAAWVARIVALHGSGDVITAEDALRAFRAAEPDADTYLPESLHDWARTVD